MPRGYLKHNKEVSRKQARGGSSHKSLTSYKSDKIVDRHDRPRIFVCIDEIALQLPQYETPQKVPTYRCGECAICFEDRPVICLSQKCRWHDHACHKCLRRVYVKDAQSSTKNFPLSCFHPLCGERVKASQLEKHQLFSTPAEFKKHHEMTALHKIESTPGMRTVLCPNCSFPRGINRFDKDRKYGCRNCKISYTVSPDYATLRCLENMKKDKIGVNDGWARCPCCSILISKGYGCDHMDCIYCGFEFSWEQAQKDYGRLARPPDDQIYLWW